MKSGLHPGVMRTLPSTSTPCGTTRFENQRGLIQFAIRTSILPLELAAVSRLLLVLPVFT
jgi:hypothetical protein